MIHTQLHHLIDIVPRRYAFHQAVDRFVNHRHQHPVGDEAGEIVHLDWRLADLHRKSRHRADSLIIGLKAADNLDQLHHRDGVEEMHSDYPLGPARRRAEHRDRNR